MSDHGFKFRIIYKSVFFPRLSLITVASVRVAWQFNPTKSWKKVMKIPGTSGVTCRDLGSYFLIPTETGS